MKKNTQSLASALRYGATFFLCLLFSTQGKSQSCVNVSSLGINTGYNYNTSAVIAAGANDPNWQVTWLTPDCSTLAGSPTLPYQAVRPNSTLWSLSNPTSQWLSFLPAGTYTTGSDIADSMDFGMTLSRTFRTCASDSFNFALNIAFDNFCTSITLDGIAMPPGAPFTQWANQTASNYTSFTAVNFGRTLTAGTHTIRITVHDFPQAGGNPHGLHVNGTITSASGSSSLVANTSPANCSCTEPVICSDQCYWKVTGNSILSGNNIFGTLSNDDVRVHTNSTQRGIITRKGLLGWNTASPTAWLHVNCTANNPDNGSLGSDVRFERLEPGKGNYLVIDAQGYVYDSHVPLNGGFGPAEDPHYDNKMQNLENELKELKAQVEALTRKAGNEIGMTVTSGSKLEQNVPNPFGKETVIGYTAENVKQTAYLAVLDLNGKQLLKYDVRQGKGSIKIEGDQLAAGVYLYTLIVDGHEADTKKMVLTK